MRDSLIPTKREVADGHATHALGGELLKSLPKSPLSLISTK
jgi:hypothetical protein